MQKPLDTESVLLATRLVPPPARSTQIARTRLLARFASLADTRVLLVCAPAGFGKTTLAAMLYSTWLKPPESHHDAPAAHAGAWLTLDESDADPARFARALAAMCDQVVPGAGEPLRAGPGVAIGDVGAAVLAGLASVAAPTLLVLDDYHLAPEQAHALIALVIERGPPSLRVLLTCRDEPPLPLARWRARGLLAEARTDDLRFDTAEADALFNSSFDLALGSDAVGELQARTEGWAVGLYLAALAVRSRPEAPPADLAGNRAALDFLAAEVLAHEPAETQAFLRATSVAERLTGELCDALVAGDPAVRQPSAALLRALERANLFVAPIDQEQRWFRYHPLFASLLRSQVPADKLATLHRRAATWHAEHALWPDAIRHALAGNDLAATAGYVASAADGALARGEIASLRGWLDALPPAMLTSDYSLAVAQAWVQYLGGDVGSAVRFVAIANSLQPRAPTDRLGLEMLESFLAIGRRDLAAAQHHSTLALSLLGNAQPVQRALLLLSLAQLQWLAGDRAALATAREAVTAARESASPLLTASTRELLVNLLLSAGRRREAERVCRQAIAAAGAETPSSADLIGLGLALYEAGESAQALAMLQAGIEAAQSRGLATSILSGGLFHALTLADLGRPDDALAALDGLRAAAPHMFTSAIDAFEAEVQLRRGALGAAARWSDQLLLDANAPDLATDFATLTVARIWLQQGFADRARALVQPLAAALRAAERRGRLVAALTVQALAEQAHGDGAAARATLAEVLGLAAPENIRRPLLDAAPALADLLRTLRDHAPTFVDGLLHGVPAPPTPPTPLAEPLTEREREVLSLAAAGRSNPEIADRLVLTVGTVKTHMHNIYQKLGVRNRVEAIAAARASGLLDDAI